MKNAYATSIVLAIAALAAGQAMAAGTAGGDIVDTETGLKFSQMFPGRYEAATTQAKTRNEVRAEVVAARGVSNGGDVVDTETGLKFSQIFPGRYEAATTQAKTRAEVRAELAAARSNSKRGDIVDSITGLKFREMFPGRYSAS